MESNVFVTNDMSFAAYLSMKGMRLLRANKLGRSFKFVFENKGNIEQLRFDYISSECSKFDDAVRKLKRIVFGDEELK